jgi:Spy/CpxP family protein refolding chaperone
MRNVTRCIAALALALAPVVGVAQAPKAGRKADPPPVRQRVQQKLQEAPGRGGLAARIGELKLTPEQKERLQDIRAKAREKVEAIRGEKELTPLQRRTRAAVARADAMAEAQKVLPPEQQKKVRSAIARRRGVPAQASQRLQGRPGAPGVARRWMQAPPAGARPWLRERIRERRGWF